MRNTNFSAIKQEYTTWLSTLGFSSETVRSYTYSVRAFLNWLDTQGVKHISTLERKHVEKYFQYLQVRSSKLKKGRLLSTSTLNDNFIAVDKLCEFLHQVGMNHTPTPTGFRITRDNKERVKKIKPFTQSEIKQLQSHITDLYHHLPYELKQARQQQLRLVFALYYGCGLRNSEGYRLTFDDIDFDKKCVFVKQGKNYKDRIVPMNQGVYKALQDYIYNFRNLKKLPHKRLFINNTDYLNKRLKDLQSMAKSKTIKNKRLTLHILRHSIATHLLQNGMSIEHIGRFLGHSSLDTTQIYTHIINDL